LSCCHPLEECPFDRLINLNYRGNPRNEWEIPRRADLYRHIAPKRSEEGYNNALPAANEMQTYYEDR
jgi:hypothetical protein